MTITTSKVDVRQIDFHGVTVDFRSGVPDHLEHLAVDYGFFLTTRSCAPKIRFDVVVGDQNLGSPSGIVIDGALGDRIVLRAPDHVVVEGPFVADERAYRSEVRAYLTATILSHVVRSRHALQVHGSAVLTNRGGVLFAGAKKMGKTSLALLALVEGARYIANDTCFIETAEGAAVDAGDIATVFGLPQSLSVNVGTATWFARARPVIGLASGVDHAADLRQLYNVELHQKEEIEPAIIDRISGVHTEPARLRNIVFPEPNFHLDQPRIRQIGTDEAGIRLAMLAESFTKWAWPVPMSAGEHLDRVREVVGVAVEEATCWHLQWTSDHDRNYELLSGSVL